VIEKQTDDYPVGEYNLSKSNAAKIIMTVLKNTVENQLSEYLTKNTKVTIKITGSTDAMPIKSKLPYSGEYGEFYNKFCFINGMLDNITITKSSGITTNEQLAFLRTYGVRKFIENYMPPFRNTNNSFEHYAKVSDKVGSKYRKITIELLIHDAFRDKFPESANDNLQIKILDIDINIPQTNIVNSNSYALIIGNEDYQSYQTSLKSEQNVEFALNDAIIFKKYCKQTLGIPKDNIIFHTNAGVVDMKRALNQINSVIKNTYGNAEIIFYYAGHGFPHEQTKEPYLIPVDVAGSDLELAIKLKEVYQKLTEYPAKKVIVFLDACFTGGGRGEGLLADRGIKIAPKNNILSGNIIVLSASSSNQSSLPYREKTHGMFTYYLLKKLQETKGEVTLGELNQYIKNNVSVRSPLVNKKDQNPQTNVSTQVQDVWKGWKMK